MADSKEIDDWEDVPIDAEADDWEDVPVEAQATVALPEKQFGESIGRGVMQGITFGYGDEITGGLDAAIQSPFSERTFIDIYRERRDFYRARNERAQETAPLQYGGGQLGGAIATVLTPSGALSAVRGVPAALQAVKARGLLPSAVAGGKAIVKAGKTAWEGRSLIGAAKGAAVGAGVGAVAGLGESEADLTQLNQDEYVKALGDSAIGAAFGAAFGGLLGGFGSKKGPTPEKLQSQLDDAVMQLKGTAETEEIGELFQASLQNNKAAFHATVDAQYDKVRGLMQGQSVSLQSVKKEAQTVLKEVELGGLGEGKLKTLLNEISSKPDDLPFEAAQRLKSSLGDALRSRTEPLGSKAARDIEKISSKTDEALETATRAVPEANVIWRGADAIYREGAEKFNSKLFSSLADSEPERVVALIAQKNKPGTIRKLKEMATPEVWEKVKGSHLNEILRLSTDVETGIVNARSALTKFRSFGDSALKETYGSDLESYKSLLKEMAELQGKSGTGVSEGYRMFLNWAGSTVTRVPVGDILTAIRRTRAANVTVPVRKNIIAVNAGLQSRNLLNRGDDAERRLLESSTKRN